MSNTPDSFAFVAALTLTATVESALYSQSRAPTRDCFPLMTASAPVTAPSPRRRFPGEFALAFSRHPTDFLIRMAREHGDVVRIPVGQEQIHLLAHPDAG